jgi:uncharacterized protein
MHGPREPLDVDRLSQEGAAVSFECDLSGLAPLRSVHAGITGRIQGRVRFGREQGFAVAELRMQGSALQQCQRCLGPVRMTLDGEARIALVGSEEEGARVPAEFEPVLAPAGRISIDQLLTEELLLTLPIVPLHAQGEAGCKAQQPATREVETHRPFARLAELVKR